MRKILYFYRCQHNDLQLHPHVRIGVLSLSGSVYNWLYLLVLGAVNKSLAPCMLGLFWQK